MDMIDRELAELPPELRWREWMRRIEAVLFASAQPVPRADLARVVGQGAALDLLIDDLAVELADRPYEVVRIGEGWMLRTGPAFGAVIRVAADLGNREIGLSERDLAVLAAIAYHQPVTRDELAEIFGQEISRELIGRLAARDLIAPGRCAMRGCRGHSRRAYPPASCLFRKARSRRTSPAQGQSAICKAGPATDNCPADIRAFIFSLDARTIP